MTGVASEFVSSVNTCGIGQIVRTFTASDANGQSTCLQTISILAPSASTASSIDWPDDYETDEGCSAGSILPDSLPAGFDFPSFTAASCTNLVATYTDQTFTFAGTGADACSKIIRTWSVIDECMHGMPGSAPIRYDQTIKVSDNVAPAIASCIPTLTVTTSNCNTGTANISNTATDNCTDDANLNATLSIDHFGDGSIQNTASYNGNEINFSGDLPLGSHIAISEYFDGCGNKATCSQTITVQNIDPPVALCQSITIPLQEMDLDGNNTIDTIMAILRAEMLDAANVSLGTSGSSSLCKYDISFSLSASVTDVVTTFDCSDIGSNVVTLHVTDSFGNASTCETTVDITDSNSRCGVMIGNGLLSGRIINEYTEAVEDVKVDLMGSDFAHQMSSDLGQYAFPAMPLGGSYVIMPTKKDNPLNGVSTLDIIAIQRHILGSQLLDSPYKIIAADVDNSGSITALDLIELRKLILGVDDQFKNVDSWRMVDSEQDFLDPANPFAGSLREDYTIHAFDQSEVVDFIGVKIGDVNNSVRLGVNNVNTEKRSEESVNIIVEKLEKLQSELIELSLTIDDLASIDGMQLSLSYDQSQVTIESIGSENDLMTISHYNHVASEGLLHMSWDNLSGVDTDNPLITLALSADNKKSIEGLLSISETHITPEIYKNGEAYNISLVNNTIDVEQTETVLYQNNPNPWSENTQIRYMVPADQDIELNFYNPTGQLLYRELKTAQAGENVSVIDNSVFPIGGVIYYELVSGDIRLIEKMLLVK